MKRRHRWQLPDPAPVRAPQEPGVRLLGDLAHAMTRAAEATEAYQFALDRLCPAVGAAFGAVFLLDDAAEVMRPVAAHAWPERWRGWLGDLRVRVGVGPVGEAAAERRLIEVDDVLADAALEEWYDVARELGFRAVVSVPIEGAEGLAGAASLYFVQPGRQDAATKALLRATADLLGGIHALDRLRHRLRLTEAALEDERSAGLRRRGDSDATAV